MSSKSLIAVILLAASSAHAATRLPEACGKDDIKFDVKTASQPAGAASPEGAQAKIVFLETLHKQSNVLVHPTIRFGLDGAWAGAVKGSSYFSVPVAPGEHHLCASWQSHFKSFSKEAEAMPLTIEPGKTYFVAYKVNFISSDEGAQPVTSFALINADEAKFLLDTARLATWTTNP